MNYRLQSAKTNPFEGLTPDEALRLYVYFTKVMDPPVNGDDIFRRFGFVPSGGTPNVFKSLQIEHEILDEMANVDLSGENEENEKSCGISKYLQEGIRLLTPEEKRELEEGCEEQLGFCTLPINGGLEFDNMIAVRDITDGESETWLHVSEETLSVLSRGIPYVFPRWSMHYIVTGENIDYVKIEIDESGIYELVLCPVKELPARCLCYSGWSLHELLSSLISGVEREFSDEEFDKIEEFERKSCFND